MSIDYYINGKQTTLASPEPSSYTVTNNYKGITVYIDGYGPKSELSYVQGQGLESVLVDVEVLDSGLILGQNYTIDDYFAEDYVGYSISF